MTDERDDLLREIGAGLAIEPSPSFLASVRERIAAEPASLRARRGLWWGVAGAAGLLATVTIALLPVPFWRGHGADVRQAALAPVAGQALPSNRDRIAAAPPAAEAVVAATQRSGRPPSARSGASTPGDSGAPRHLEVLIPPDEAAALRSLLLAMKSGRAQVPPSRVAIDPETGVLLPLENIVIPPITIGTLGDREGTGGRRDR